MFISLIVIAVIVLAPFVIFAVWAETSPNGKEKNNGFVRMDKNWKEISR